MQQMFQRSVRDKGMLFHRQTLDITGVCPMGQHHQDDPTK